MSEQFDLGALVEEFRDEGRDQVDRLDEALLHLEREGTLPEERRREVLRVLHTLKGNAGMLGLGAIRDFVHVLENVLKEAGGDWSGELLERLFEAAARLRHAVDQAGREGEAGAAESLKAARVQLESTSSGVPSAPEPRVGGGGDAELAEPGPDRLRVPFGKLDALLNQVGELIGEAEGLLDAAEESDAAPAVRERAETVRRRVDVLRESVMELRLVPLGRVLGRFQGLVRRLARDQDKEARLVLEGESTEVDKSTADALAEPLLHLVRNAVDHGIEAPAERESAGKPRHGTVTIRARQEGDAVRIEVEDDGGGISVERIVERARAGGLLSPGETLDGAEALDLVFEPGLSTRSAADTVSGRGVGLDVVRRSVRALRGDVSVEAVSGAGTRFVLELPLTVAIVPSLVFEAGGEVLAVPVSAVERTVRLESVERVGRAEVLRGSDGLVPLARPGSLFGWRDGAEGTEGFAVLVRAGRGATAIVADRLLDQRDLVVKAVPAWGSQPPGVSAVSVLTGGRVALMLDPAEVMELNRKRGDGA